MSKKCSWMDPVAPRLTTEPSATTDIPGNNTNGASWFDPVLPVDTEPKFNADFTEPVSTESFTPLVKSEKIDLKRKKDATSLSTAELEIEERKRFNYGKSLARAKKWNNFKDFNQRVKLLNKRFQDRPPRPWLLDHHREMLLLNRKNNLLKIQAEQVPRKPVQNDDEKWASFYEQYNIPLKSRPMKSLHPSVTKFSLEISRMCSNKEAAPNTKPCATFNNGQEKVLKDILCYLKGSSVEVDLTDHKSETKKGSHCKDINNSQLYRIEGLKFNSQNSCVDNSQKITTEIESKDAASLSDQSSDTDSVDSGSEDSSDNTLAIQSEDMERKSSEKCGFLESRLNEVDDSDADADSDSNSDSSTSSASDLNISDQMQALEVDVRSKPPLEEEDNNSSDDPDSEDHMDEGLFNLLGASAFVEKIHEPAKAQELIPVTQPPNAATVKEAQPQIKKEILPTMGSVDFITKEISLILDQMMPLDLYDAVWRHHHLHYHATLPVWDRMPIAHIPVSGHQMGADQNLVRAFDGFRPLLPSISTFYLDIQVKAAAELSIKLGRYVHPGKAIEASKQVAIPRKLSEIIPRYCYRHVSFL